MRHSAHSEMFQVQNDLFTQKFSFVKNTGNVLFTKTDKKDASDVLHKRYLPHNDNIQRITVCDVCVEIPAVISVLPEYKTKIITIFL
jgi:hypothetical protein